MAFQSTFYDTSADKPESLITETKWSDAHPAIGSSEYGVVGPGDFTVTAHPSTPFAVNVSPGQAWGHGVFDESTGIEIVQCVAPDPGTTRWDLIAIQRDWRNAAGGPTALVAVAGGTIKDIPEDRQNTPGTVDDQPLFLVQWKAGQTQPQAIVDLRLWAGNGGAFAKDDLVRKYLTRPGSEINIDGIPWCLRIGPGDTLFWDKTEPAEVIVAGATSRPWIQAGEVKVTTNKYGVGFVNFPESFPHRLRAFVINDTTRIPGSGVENQGVICKPLINQSTAAQGQFLAYNYTATGVLANTPLYVTYIAAGD